MAWCLVTPASRGIGFALTRQLLQSTRIPVVATARSDVDRVRESILQGLNVDAKRLTVLEMDVTDEATISTAASTAKSLFPTSSHHLRLSFAIPGILHPEKSPLQISAQDCLDTFKVNTIGPLLIMKHFSPFLPTKKTDVESQTLDPAGLPGEHAVWATMSARVGSITDNHLGGWYSYRASKAAVNSFTKTFDLYLRNTSGEKAMAIAIHPGTVKTALSKDFWNNVKKEKLFSPEFAAEKLVGVARDLGLDEGRGRCWDWAGKVIPP